MSVLLSAIVSLKESLRVSTHIEYVLELSRAYSIPPQPQKWRQPLKGRQPQQGRRPQK